MDINALSIKLTKEEAIEKALNGNGYILNKLFFKNKKIYETRLHYIEFKLVTMKIKYKKSKFNSASDEKVHELKILVDGSTGSGSIVQDVPEYKVIKNVDADIVQCSDKDDRRVRAKANKMAMRITHRFMGRIPDIEIDKIQSIFRPYWVVFFDEVEQNKKVRYLPIEADGFAVRRSV